jgi:mRNA-degrading endonuclease RelE of RelBE toxin-antitoxin system
VYSGDYRIVYAVEREVLSVVIVQVGHRREEYRRI